MNLDPAPGTVAAVFVALAEPSRRQVIGVLAARGVATATSIAEDLAITRQAVTKHLATLADAGLVESQKAGREVRYRLRPEPLRLAARWLDTAAGAWDGRLAAVKDAIEREPLMANVRQTGGSPLAVLAPLPPMHHICGGATAFLDVGVWRGLVVSPVSDRDGADRVVVTRHLEFSAERI